MGKNIKRPKLATGYDGPRKGRRSAVSLDATCRIGNGEAFPVGVLDLDNHGCRLRGFTAAVTKADEVALTIGEVGPFLARVRWAKRGGAGLKFDTALCDSEVVRAEDSAEHSPPSRVVQLIRRSG